MQNQETLEIRNFLETFITSGAYCARKNENLNYENKIGNWGGGYLNCYHSYDPKPHHIFGFGIPTLQWGLEYQSFGIPNTLE